MKLDRTIKPFPKDEINFSLPAVENLKTNQGLQIFMAHKANLPLIQFNLVLNAGSRLDPDDKKGLSNLVAITIDEGAGDYNSLELSDQFEILGTSFNVSADEDLITFSIKTLKEDFSRSFDLLKTIINSPHFDVKDFEREKRKVLVRLLQIKDDPEEIADTLFEKLIFGGSNQYAYPTIGDDKSLSNIDISSVKDFYKEYFFPKNSALFVAGDFDREEIIQCSNSLFENQNDKQTIDLDIDSTEKKETKIYLFHKPDAAQSEIRIGHISDKRDEANYYTKLLMNNILGGQFSSRINLNLREKKGYTYGAFSRFNYYKDAGYFYVSTSVGTENTVNAVKEILSELKEIQNGAKEEELVFSKSSIVRRFPSNFETNKQITSNLISKYLFSLPDNYFNNYIDKIESTKLEDVNIAAKENISVNNLVILIVGDKNKIANELIQLQLGNIFEVNEFGDIIEE